MCPIIIEISLIQSNSIKSTWVVYFGYILATIILRTRVRGIKRSASDRRREGEGFDARPEPRHS